MKCPHCQISFRAEPKHFPLGDHGRNKEWALEWVVTVITCPTCVKPSFHLDCYEKSTKPPVLFEAFMAYPRQAAKPPAPPEVPESIAKDFNEAAAVITISPQASAGLSRRCLQHVLMQCKVSKSNNLSIAIDEALASGLPTHLATNLDYIRNIGNFAAHPQKAEHSGEIIPVTPEEAEWTLDVLQTHFDFYYVQPASAAAMRSAMDAKLAEAGKSPMKEPPKCKV